MPPIAWLKSLRARTRPFRRPPFGAELLEARTVPASLTLAIAADSVSEAAGANATTATVTRVGDTSTDLTVNLTSGDTTEATVPATVVIPAGQASATFPIAAVDDSIVDGTRTVTVNASAQFNAGQAFGLDTSFGTGGIATASMQMVIQPPEGALAIQDDGKIVIAAEDGSGGGWRVQRFNPNGALDTTFGSSGTVTTPVPGGTFPVPHKIVVQADGKILVGGKFSGGIGTAALARYNPNGTLDTTFGAPVVGTSLRTGFADLANAGGWIDDMAVRTDGKILLAVAFNGTVFFRVAQLTTDGQFDGGFGVKTYSSINAQSHALVLLPDGRYILAGDRTVARFLPGGAIDTTFGAGGVRTLDFGSAAADVLDARLDPAGRIVLGGVSTSQFVGGSSNNFDDFAAARLTPDGNPDPSFGGDGTVVTDVGGLDDIPAALAVQADGKVVLAGYAELSDSPLSRTAVVVRYNADGTPDTTFGAGGVFRAHLAPTAVEVLMDGALQADGKLVVLDGFGTSYRVARIDMGPMTLTASDTLDVLDNDVANRAPVAADQVATTDEDTVKSGQVSATDADGDRLSYVLVSGPAHGTLVLAPDGTFTYTPAANYNGPDSFTFKANDGSLDSNTATVSISITAVNDAPVAAGFQFGTDEDTPLNETLRASDVDGDSLTYIIVSQPAQGSVQITNTSTGAFTYTPPLNFNGTVSFTFKVNDGTVDSNVATVFVTVRPVNDAPVAQNLGVSTDEDTALTGQVVATDVDGPALTYLLVSGPAHGTLTLNADGSFTYTPAADYNGPDSFTFKASDGSLASNVATVSITVTPVNDPPVASGQNLSTPEDTDLLGTLSAIDVDGDTLSYAVQAPPAHGTLALNAGGSFTYTPALNYNGPDSFTFKVSDGNGGTDTATVGITVTPVNDPPVAQNQSVSTKVNAAVTGQAIATDVDSPSLTYVLVGGPAHGTLSFAADGSFTYTPAANYNGPDGFTFKANDGQADSNVATVSISVAGGSPQVAIDIRPDGGNAINVKSHGKIEVAILSTAGLDARTVDVNSLHFGRTGTEASLSMNPKQGPRFRLEDVNGDGRLDLVVEFETDLTGFRAGDTTGILTGQLLDGTAFSATDSVSVKSPGK